MSWGIPHFFTDPHCPKQNGRVERLHQTAEYEYFNYQYDLLDDLDEINNTACYLTQNTILKDSTEA